jgi:O-succinylbenzoate synthase
MYQVVPSFCNSHTTTMVVVVVDSLAAAAHNSSCKALYQNGVHSTSTVKKLAKIYSPKSLPHLSNLATAKTQLPSTWPFSRYKIAQATD